MSNVIAHPALVNQNHEKLISVLETLEDAVNTLEEVTEKLTPEFIDIKTCMYGMYNLMALYLGLYE